MRGEDSVSNTVISTTHGSPPHARGRRRRRRLDRRSRGLTPACAGKTSTTRRTPRTSRAHPCMRGEDCEWLSSHLHILGSPPHARGRRRYVIVERNNLGLTPACAGKTDCPATISRRQGAHPRMRGEDLIRKRKLPPVKGSPPHARGRHVIEDEEEFWERLTPACAGKTVRFPRESDKVVLQFTNFS